MENAFSKFTFHVGLISWLSFVCVQDLLPIKSPSPLPSTALSDVYNELYNEDWLVGFQRATFLPVDNFFHYNFLLTIQNFQHWETSNNCFS